MTYRFWELCVPICQIFSLGVVTFMQFSHHLSPCLLYYSFIKSNQFSTVYTSTLNLLTNGHPPSLPTLRVSRWEFEVG